MDQTMPLVPECQFKEILNRSLNNIDTGCLTYNINNDNRFFPILRIPIHPLLYSPLFFLTWYI